MLDQESDLNSGIMGINSDDQRSIFHKVYENNEMGAG